MTDHPPEEVLQADRRRHQENIRLANLSRRLKKKLLEDAGARPDPPPPYLARSEEQMSDAESASSVWQPIVEHAGPA